MEPFFDWLHGNLKERHLDLIPKDNGEKIFDPGRVVGFRSANTVLHKIQFGASNRICVKIQYGGQWKTVEPLSFRVSQNGNRLFYGFEREDGQTKAFAVDKIQSVKITSIPYEEKKHPVEITASGSVTMPPLRSGLQP